MYLKSLELSGFKSFAKKANLNFNTPITAIVGPNGSGKSNVAEAFKFVLGEQSIKSLRGKRGEDLIWNGGGDSPRANRGAVKLIFDNSRRVFSTIDFDEVSIERVVNRDNTNEYLLNGSQVRLKDVVELLASAHVGASGHHIISQGEADRILTASIRERREMIEDALGLKIYQWKKMESIRKLERTEENMKQVESLRREIAPHIKFLKKQVEKIEKSRELRSELVGLYREYFAIESGYIYRERSRLEAEKSGPEGELKELSNKLENLRKILTDARVTDERTLELVSLEKDLSAHRSRKDEVNRELGRIDGEISAIQRAVAKERDKQKRDEFKTVYLSDLEKVIAHIEGLSTINDARKLFTEIMEHLKTFIKKHKDQSDSSFIGESEKDIERLKSDRISIEKEVSDIIQSENNIVGKYNQLKRSIEEEKDTNRDTEKEIFRVIARQNELRSVLSGMSGSLIALSKEEENLKRELGEAASIAGRDATEYDSSGVFDADRIAQEERRRRIERIKIRLEDSGLGGSSDIMKEYKETEERDVFLARELTDLEKAKEELNKLIQELDIRIDYEFKNGIIKINSEFQNFFTLMFGGGKAELNVVREMKRKKKSDSDELSKLLDETETYESSLEELEESGPEGLEVNVSLPRKKVKGLMMLSGGERALTSIALLFAISQVNPPPFIILDETDAALDEANSKKYGDMIESLSRNSQLILITHNRETMSRAGVLYGVTMGSDGASRLLSIAFEDAVKVAK